VSEKLTRFQKEKINEQLLEDTLFKDSFKYRSRVIENLEGPLEDESIALEDSGVPIPSPESQFSAQECYAHGMEDGLASSLHPDYESTY